MPLFMDPPPAHSLLCSSLDLSPDDLRNNMCEGDNILNISWLNLVI
jgi:hypothetical protein